MEKQYYFKEVEAAVKRSRDIMSRLYTMFDLPFEEDSDFIRWSPYTENKAFSEDEIEEMALSEKNRWDMIIEKSALMERTVAPLLDSWEVSIKVLSTLYEIASEAESNQISLDFLSIIEAEKDLPPLALTAEESYWALMLLSPEHARKALSTQAPHAFNILHSSLAKGKSIFVNEYSKVNPQPFIGLRSLLLFALRDRFSLSRFQEDILSINVDRLTIDNIISNNLEPDDAEAFDWAYSQEHDIIENPDDFNKMLTAVPGILSNVNNQVCNITFSLLTSPYINSTQKRQVESIYNEWKLVNHSYIEQNEVAEILKDKDRLSSICLCRIDKWLLATIHECIENPETVKSFKMSNSIRYVPGNSIRMMFPKRVASVVKDNILQNGVLEGLYDVYGRYLENINGSIISEDEFIYLFGGSVDYPDRYSTPYFWNTDDKIFAGLIRLLYDYSQPSNLDSIILPVRDRETYVETMRDNKKIKSSIQWSSKKNGLGADSLAPIENILQDIVRSVAEADLRPVDMTSKTNAKGKGKE